MDSVQLPAPSSAEKPAGHGTGAALVEEQEWPAGHFLQTGDSPSRTRYSPEEQLDAEEELIDGQARPVAQ